MLSSRQLGSGMRAYWLLQATTSVLPSLGSGVWWCGRGSGFLPRLALSVFTARPAQRTPEAVPRFPDPG